MKNKLLQFLLFCLPFGLQAQNHDGVYTIVIARNANGNILANTAINLRYSIHDSAANGAVVYQETFSTTTSAQGMFNVTIGKGTPVIGSFNSINWGTNEKFVQTEMATNGNNFIDMGTQQMMSVPYAIHAKTAEKAESVTNAGVGFNGYAVFDSVGSFTWTVPSGVHKIIVECWGGGGGGGNNLTNGTAIISIGVTGGGGYAKSIFAVSPGTNYNIDVGDGGNVAPQIQVNSGTPLNNNGFASTFGNNIVIANGGEGGGFIWNSGQGFFEGGPGGTSIGQISFQGQSGVYGFVNGSNFSRGIGGNSPNGGFGGKVPGGGGEPYQNGAHGRVIITY